MDNGFLKVAEEEEVTNGKSNFGEQTKERKYSFSLASLELLTKYEKRKEQLKRKQVAIIFQGPSNSTGGHKLSTAEIMKIAKTIYINQTSNDLSMFINPLGGDRSGFSSQEADDVELALFLFASVDKTIKREFDPARKFLAMCFHMASPMGNSVQRLVHCYAEALQERISRQNGIISSEIQESCQDWKSDLDKVITGLSASGLAYWQELPFLLVVESVGIQHILESVTSAKRIHLIELGTRTMSQWSSLIRALAVREECPIEILKITVISTKSKSTIEETGRRLSKFAEGMSLPFSFNLVMVSEMKDLNKHLINLDSRDAVAVHCELALLAKITPPPDQLETTVKVIKSLHPVVMVVYKVEANTTSMDLMDRFIDSFVMYSAHFDSLEDCMDRCNPNRLILENLSCKEIQDIIAFEEEERTVRITRIDEWRALFKHFGVVETELSMLSLYQANLVIKKYSCWSSCTLDMDGKSLLVGWKGIPLFSVSAWKFQSE